MQGAGTAELQAGQWALHKGLRRRGTGPERPGLCPKQNQWQQPACPGASASTSNTRHEVLGESEANTSGIDHCSLDAITAADTHSLCLHHIQELDNFSRAQNDQDGNSLITG